MSERREHRVLSEESGRTVLRILHDACGASHATARGWIAAGRVTRNGERVTRGEDRVASGDVVMAEFDPGTKYREPPRARKGDGFRVLHEDEHLAIVDKEPGVLTIAASTGDESALEDRLLLSYRRRGLKKPFVKAVHRIDRFTSGVVAFARSEAAWKALREQFAARTPERLYLAIVEGRILADEGTLRHRLEEDEESLKVRTVSGRRGLDAACSFRVRERFPLATLLEVRLLTGRRNQIRVQFAAEGHPLVGDKSYGRESPLIPRSALHAWQLTLDHPASRKRMKLESTPPADFEALVEKLRRGAAPAEPRAAPVQRRERAPDPRGKPRDRSAPAPKARAGRGAVPTNRKRRVTPRRERGPRNR